ncbi:MAG: methyltransferase domain-containing protein [Kangiellaceae bacterium]|nr:methyltransferase domain-containing protein [Kangiellaceae bacterium]
MYKVTSQIAKWKQALHNELEQGFSIVQFEIATDKLKLILSGIFGYHALLFSLRAKELVNENSTIRNSVVLSEKKEASHLRCRFEELPIASDTIDLVVLPETLHQSQFPHQILREVERVLIPEGYVVLIMENPISWTSFKRRLISRIIRKTTSNKTIGKLRIADWFRLLGLEIVNEIPICADLKTDQNGRISELLKRIYQIGLNHLSGHYILIAKKKVSTLTPIRPSWRSNRKLVSPRFADPSVNRQVDDYLKQLKR